MKGISRALGALVVVWLTTMAAAATLAMQRKRTAPPLPASDADEVQLTAIFDGLEYRSTATAFRGGTIECWFGGGSIDLRGATLHPDGAHLQTTTVFGGGQILVPEHWVVETNLVGIGGAGDARTSAKTVDEAPLAPRLVIDGVVAFGGFGIMSSDARPEVVATA